MHNLCGLFSGFPNVKELLSTPVMRVETGGIGLERDVVMSTRPN